MRKRKNRWNILCIENAGMTNITASFFQNRKEVSFYFPLLLDEKIKKFEITGTMGDNQVEEIIYSLLGHRVSAEQVGNKTFFTFDQTKKKKGKQILIDYRHNDWQNEDLATEEKEMLIPNQPRIFTIVSDKKTRQEYRFTSKKDKLATFMAALLSPHKIQVENDGAIAITI